MGSPYLNSGEVIVLTTNRVSADSVPYDVMLTTERIFLIDNRNARFEPRIVPLSTILSIQAGKTPTLDPVITLLFHPPDEGSVRQPLNLVFSQSPNENRKSERDDWVRSLLQLSITKQKKADTDVHALPAVPADSGLRPAVRHGIAPEKMRPLSNVVDHKRTPAPVTVIPDEVAGSGGMPAHAAAVLPVRQETPLPPYAPAGPAPDDSPVHGAPHHAPAPPARVIIPQIIEELLPVKKSPAAKEDAEPVPDAGFDEDALFRSIPAAARFTTGTGERAPAVPGAETGPETAAVVPKATIPPADVPEIIRALHTGAVEPVIPASPAAVLPDTLPEPAQEIPQEGGEAIPESQVSLAIPETVVAESVSHPAPETVLRRENAAAETPPPGRHPIPPAREIRPLWRSLAYAAALILIIALIAAGVMLLLPQGPGLPGTPVSPAPAPGQVTTIPQVTESPVTAPPVTTGAVTPVPSPAASSIPPEGVWVRVNSTSYFFGTVGNPDLRQEVSGKGDHFYRILKSNRSVQVSVQKQDNTGSLLAVSIYRDGILVGSRSVTSPMGAVDLLIDPQTARAPGLTENDTLPEHAATPAGLENY